MRSKVTAAMSGVSAVVVLLSLRSAHGGATAHLAAAPAGIIAAAPPTPSALVVPRTAAPTQRTAGPAPAQASRAPRRVVTAAVAPRPSRAGTRPTPRPAPSPTKPTTVTVNGAPADTQYGPVQVQITLRGGRIIRSDAIEYPNSGSRDREINSQAIPQLNDETVQANSAQIDTVSGATYTSDGYRQSLQSAIDAAHRAGAR